MNITLRSFILLVIGAWVAGCAPHPDPIIDTKGVNPVAMEQDWNECESYSDQVIIRKGVAKGAAVTGAATGAIGGNAEQGAGYGAIWGAARSTLDGDRE
jgi:hypothetical protein